MRPRTARRHARWAGVTGATLLAAAGILGGWSNAAQAVCVPPITGCPPPPTAPTAQVGRANATGYRTAIVRGRVNPDGAATTYHWIYRGVQPANLSPHHTKDFSLPGDRASHTVKTPLNGLVPGESYSIELVASNHYGSHSDNGAQAFQTPQHPELSGLHLGRSEIKLGDSPPRASVRVRGAFNPYVPLHVLVSRAPYHRWRLTNDQRTPARSGTTHMQICASEPAGGCPALDRNFLVEVQDGRARTSPKVVWVDPVSSVNVYREKNGSSPWLDPVFTAQVHYVTHRQFHRQRVFFYLGPRRKGPWTRVGSGLLSRESSGSGMTTLTARTRYKHNGTGFTWSCVRHSLLRDMGRPFFFKACGDKHIR
jgi:hypothetical protein